MWLIVSFLAALRVCTNYVEVTYNVGTAESGLSHYAGNKWFKFFDSQTYNELEVNN